MTKFKQKQIHTRRIGPGRTTIAEAVFFLLAFLCQILNESRNIYYETNQQTQPVSPFSFSRACFTIFDWTDSRNRQYASSYAYPRTYLRLCLWMEIRVTNRIYHTASPHDAFWNASTCNSNRNGFRACCIWHSDWAAL